MIKHTVVSIYTKHKFIVTAWIASAINAKDRDVTTQANPTFSLTQIIRAFWLTQSCVGKRICSCEVTMFCGARTIYAITIHLRYAWLPTTVLTNERLISRSICTQILITFLYETRKLSSSLICRSPHSSCIPTIYESYREGRGGLSDRGAGASLILRPRGSTLFGGQVRMARNRGQPAVLILGSFLGIFNS